MDKQIHLSYSNNEYFYNYKFLNLDEVFMMLDRLKIYNYIFLVCDGKVDEGGELMVSENIEFVKLFLKDGFLEFHKEPTEGVNLCIQAYDNWESAYDVALMLRADQGKRNINLTIKEHIN